MTPQEVLAIADELDAKADESEAAQKNVVDSSHVWLCMGAEAAYRSAALLIRERVGEHVTEQALAGLEGL